MLKEDKYKCVEDPLNRKEVLGAIKKPSDWKSDFLGYCDDGHSYAIRTNLRALSGKDVIDFLQFTYKLKFEIV